MHRLKKIGKIFLKVFIGFGIFLILFALFFWWRIQVPLPEINKNLSPSSFTRKQIATNYYRVNDCWLKKNKYGIWEMYIEGDAYERGLIYGVLAKELIEKQETYFVNQINELVPGKIYQNVLKCFIAWFNKDMYKYLPEENQQEIYGISLSFSDKFDYVGPKYYRILNYHAAHDIGHALSDFSMVGCTSFALTKEFSEDSNLLIGRNFDFYMGDDFARDKLLVFVNPKTGYKFASYSWAGLTGVVSGMNEMGLTVTINASKSDFPFASKEPISILAREILQYAKNTEEAITIAKKREIFVSESLLIGSAEDDKAIIIEKSPQKMDVYSGDKNLWICANHYQSKLFMLDSVNLLNMSNSDSKYRFNRMKELLDSSLPLNQNKAVQILRNKEGAGNKNIGLGNPKSLNQLIAHHSVVFKPKQMKMWISTSPYQLGGFICYDLREAFKKNGQYIVDSLTIKEDAFLQDERYKKYEQFKNTKQKIKKFVLFNIPFSLDTTAETAFIQANPDSYITYMELGDYYKKIKKYEKANTYYLQALDHDVASVNETEVLKKNISVCKKNQSK